MVEKGVMYEEAVRIPWLMRIPQMKRQGHVIKGRVSQIDMVPTLLELMGKQRVGRFPGRSLVPVIKGGKESYDHVYIEWNSNGDAPKPKKGDANLTAKEELKRIKNENSRAVISPDGWKLCLSDVDKCQLFNLVEDPGETINLFDSGKHDQIIRRLTDKIHQWQEVVGDKVKV